MTWRSEESVRETYADLLDGEDDAAGVLLSSALDAGYNLHRPPPAIRSMPALRPRREVWEKVDRLGPAAPMKRPWGLHTKFYAAISVVTGVLLMTAASVTTAGTNHPISYLGAMTHALPPRGNPAGEFRRVKTSLHVGKKPEVLFIGTSVDDSSSSERWPLVKALAQFGVWHNLVASGQLNCYQGSVAGAGASAVGNGVYCWDPSKYPGPPTYSLDRAGYASKYISFVNRDVIDHK